MMMNLIEKRSQIDCLIEHVLLDSSAGAIEE